MGDQEKDGTVTKDAADPQFRTEDDINEILKLVEDETENFLLKAAAKSTNHGSAQQTTAEDGLYSKKNTKMTSEERQENIARTRMGRNNQSRPARYVNGVRLSDEEVANIT